MTLIRDSIIT